MEENNFMALGDKNRDQEKQSAELLRRSLAVPAGAPGSEIDACPDAEILAAYSERSLDADEAARWNLHFSQCARCREQLVVLVRARDSAGTTEIKRPRAPSIVWDWRWLAPAAAAIIFVIVVQVFRPPHRAGEQQIVAMNESATPRSTATAVPESSRAVGNSASGIPSPSGSLERTAPNLDSAKSKIAPPAKSAPPSRDETKELASNTPLAGRNYEQLDTVKKSAAAPKADSSEGHGNGRGNAVGNGIGISGSKQTVTVEAAAAPVTPAPAPPQIPTGDSVSAAAPAPGAAYESAHNQQTVVVTANRARAMSESVMVQPADDRDARTLVRSPDPDVLWRISGGRFVERSSDAGASWRVQWTNANAHVVAGAAPSIETCWLVGRDAMILVTTDGRKWKTIAPPADADFVDVTATDASSATVTTTDDRKFTTSDGGKHWTPAP
jgi:hypothetical protein